MDALVVNNTYPLVCLFGLNVRDSDPPPPPPKKKNNNKIVSKWMVIHRNRGLSKVVEESGKKDFATKCMSGIDKAGQ